MYILGPTELDWAPRVSWVSENIKELFAKYKVEIDDIVRDSSTEKNPISNYGLSSTTKISFGNFNKTTREFSKEVDDCDEDILALFDTPLRDNYKELDDIGTKTLNKLQYIKLQIFKLMTEKNLHTKK